MADKPDNLTRDQLLALLGPVRRKGEWTMALCPLSCRDGDSHPTDPLKGASLGLSSKGVLKCFSGCDGADLYRHFRAKFNEQGGDRQPRRAQQDRKLTETDGEWHVRNRPPDIAYEFRDTAGELTAVHGRWNYRNAAGDGDKTFRWRLPEGEYRRGLEGRTEDTLPLYGAHELPEAGPVAYVEGEKAAHACREAGLFAVTGAGGGSQREWGDSLAILNGRDVFLWPDNDPPGRALMDALEKKLRAVAGRVVWLHPEAKPKDDADDYFVGNKRTISDLLANALLEPSTDAIAGDHFKIRVPTGHGILGFELEEMTRGARALDCLLTVTDESPEGEPTPFRRRINLMSGTAMDGLARALANQFGSTKETGINWTAVLSTVSARAIDGFGEVDHAIQVAQVPQAGTLTYVVDGMVPEHQPTILFGDGESSKTWMAIDMGLSVMWGSPWHGHAVKQGGVLLLDYESTLIGLRMRRMLQGRDLDPAIMPDLPFFYRSASEPLWEIRDEVKRFIEANDIVLLIVDNGADACGGPPEQSDPTLQYFRGLSYIGITSITVCHNRAPSTDPKDRSHTFRPYGNRYWHNKARRTWYLATDAEEAVSEYNVAFTSRKVSDGQKPEQFAIHMQFDDSDPELPGPLEITLGRMRNAGAGLQSVKSNALQIAEAIAAKGGQSTYAEIAELTSLKLGSIRSTLSRRRDLFVPLPKRGREAVFGLMEGTMT